MTDPTPIHPELEEIGARALRKERLRENVSRWFGLVFLVAAWVAGIILLTFVAWTSWAIIRGTWNVLERIAG